MDLGHAEVTGRIDTHTPGHNLDLGTDGRPHDGPGVHTVYVAGDTLDQSRH